MVDVVEHEMKVGESVGVNKQAEQNIHTTQRLFAAWADGDMDTVLSLVDDNFAVHYNFPGAHTVPWQGEWLGKAAFLKFLDALQQGVQRTGRLKEVHQGAVPTRNFAVFNAVITNKNSSATLLQETFHILMFNQQGKMVNHIVIEDSATVQAFMQGKYIPDPKMTPHKPVSSAAENDPQRNMEVIKDCYACWARQDVEGLFGHFAVNIVTDSNFPGLKAVPWQGHYEGHAGSAEYFQLLQSESMITGGIMLIDGQPMMKALPGNRVHVLFQGKMIGRKSKKVWNNLLSEHLHVLDNNYKVVYYRELTDLGTAAAVLAGTYGDARRRAMDCAKLESVNHCTLYISSDNEDELVQLGVQHAVSSHGHADTAELREMIRAGLFDE